MSQILKGIRIIDATHVLAGPFATYQLAVFGADVIKVESPEGLDESRLFGGADRALNEKAMGLSYLAQGANKRSLLLNLKRQEQIDAFKRLVATADVLVENFSGSVFDALGLGYDALRAINPRLIYTSISGFGRSGTRTEHKAYDQVIQASAGVMRMTGTRETGPLKAGAPMLDYGTGVYAAFAIAVALFDRERTGEGQKIDIAMSDVALMFASPKVIQYLRNGQEPEPRGNDGALATTSCYPTKDGLLVIAAGNLKLQAKLWTLLGRPDMIRDTYPETVANFEQERATLASILVDKAAIEWEKFFQGNGVPASRVRSLGEAVDEANASGRGVLHSFPYRTEMGGSFTVPVSPIVLSHDGPEIVSPPPHPGQNTREILLSLGYSIEEVNSILSTHDQI